LGAISIIAGFVEEIRCKFMKKRAFLEGPLSYFFFGNIFLKKEAPREKCSSTTDSR